MIDWNKPVRMKSGFTVKILTTDATGNCPVVGQKDGAADLFRWDLDGIYYKSDGISISSSLENIPEAVAPVEIQEAFNEGYEAGIRFDPCISHQMASAWNNSMAKSMNIGKRVV